MKPVRWYVINAHTDIMHIYGYCQHTKPRAVPIRLFDSAKELEAYVGRPLKLCKACQKTAENEK